MDVNWWVANALQDGGYIYLLSWIFWVIFSICLHELGHGWAALHQGDDTPRLTGHMTMNPLVHMGQTSLIMFAVIGIAWGQMPVNPGRFRQGRLGDAKVALAGPAMNLILALISLTALGAILALTAGAGKSNSEYLPYIVDFLLVGGWLNLVLLLLNLLPIPPLDGSRVMAAASNGALRFYSHEFFRRYSLIGILAIFWFGMPYIEDGAGYAATWWVDMVRHVLT